MRQMIRATPDNGKRRHSARKPLVGRKRVLISQAEDNPIPSVSLRPQGSNRIEAARTHGWNERHDHRHGRDDGAGADELVPRGRNTSASRWVFDALPEAKIKSPHAAQSGLRAFYTGCSAPNPKYPAGRWVPKDGGGHTYEAPGSWVYWTSDSKWHMISTEIAARRLQHGIDRAMPSGATALRSRFRVEQTSVGHSDIPARYSPLLLDDIAATVPNATPAPPSTKRPTCVANDDWLTRLPQKPGGDDPPPPKP